MRLDLFDNSGFNRGAPRITEVAWVLVKGLFFLNWFPWPSLIRRNLLRLFGARIGKGVVIRSFVNISFPWRFECGDHVWIGEEVIILSLARVVIASHVCVSQRAFLCTGSHDWRKETFDLRVAEIHLEHGSWVAAQAFIGPGTTVGAGSVVCAGSVLMRSVPTNSMVRGNPATITSKS